MVLYLSGTWAGSKVEEICDCIKEFAEVFSKYIHTHKLCLMLSTVISITNT